MLTSRGSVELCEVDDEIDLTNLIDPLVMLCGLLMLLLPTIKGLTVRSSDLAAVGGIEVPAVAKNDRLLIEFDADGKLTWNGEALDENAVSERFQALAKDSIVFLAGDQAALYGTGLRIRCKLQDAGIQAYELTEQPKSNNRKEK